MLSEKMVAYILHDYRIFNCEVLIREDITVDQFIDVVLGNRKYIRAIYVRFFDESGSEERLFRLVYGKRQLTDGWKKIFTFMTI